MGGCLRFAPGDCCPCRLACAGAGGAWCGRWGGSQELVAGGGPVERPGPDLLLHADRSGATTRVPTHARVRHLQSTADAAWVALDVGR
jgi:hypothetical protein